MFQQARDQKVAKFCVNSINLVTCVPAVVYIRADGHVTLMRYASSE